MSFPYLELLSLLLRSLPASALPSNYSCSRLFGKGPCLFPGCGNKSDESKKTCHGDFWAPCLVQLYSGILTQVSMPFFQPENLAELYVLYKKNPTHPGWSEPNGWTAEEILKYGLGYKIPDGFLQPEYPIVKFYCDLKSTSITNTVSRLLRTYMLQESHRNYRQPLVEYYSPVQIRVIIMLAEKYFDTVCRD